MQDSFDRVDRKIVVKEPKLYSWLWEEGGKGTSYLWSQQRF